MKVLARASYPVEAAATRYRLEQFVVDQMDRASGETRRRTREVAERLFNLRTVGVERYARLYEGVT